MKKIFFLVLLSLFLSTHNQSFANKKQAEPDAIEFTTVGSAEDSIANSKITVNPTTTTNQNSETIVAETKSNDSLWRIFAAGFVLGLIAFTLPCIFPMVPLTISFFTKRAETKGKGIQGAVLYGISINVIYVSLGLLTTLIFGASALNELATDGFFNVFIFLILLVFGISFLGVFEITLPSSFVNKLDAKSDSKGLTGIFFMAATLAVVSFSCTGPLIGTLLVTVGSSGNYLAPVMGMFGFSFALSSIFVIFAIFPSWLTSLPKSGGWLNSIKVVLGFIEIALAFKFLSTADLAYHWGILDREVFLVIWITISFFIGFYLLGKIKFSHDSDLKFVSTTRLFLAGIAFSFAIYMVPGLWGAPLKVISGLTPPMSTQDFVSSGNQTAPKSASLNANGQTKKYSEFLHIPHQIDGFFDYEEAIAYAKTINKPLFLDFTGHGCVNCREMEARVWSDPSVLKILKEKYVVVSLYTDDKTELPENEQFESKVLQTKVNTIGKKFKHLQAEKYNTISQPYYVLIDSEGKLLVSPPIGVEFNIKNYINYLEQGISNFTKLKTEINE
ncbi:MAG: thioredoxin family protein [Sphingobacteriaceae bacterium]|nr:thioredoxin family protein [Sphingobacteriaceae bacterium]